LKKFRVDETVLVKGVTWETVLLHFGLLQKKIALVKIDIEGAELDLLESFE